MTGYQGPLRDEPLAIELHNTHYAVPGRALIDGLADDNSTRAWLAGLTPWLPHTRTNSRSVPRTELIELRSTVREALHAIVAGDQPTRESLASLNAFSARAPSWRVARWQRDSVPIIESEFGTATHEEILLATLATSTIELLTGPQSADIRACGAPGCVLLYLKNHPRRGWCSAACGNRARQARHYRRTHT